MNDQEKLVIMANNLEEAMRRIEPHYDEILGLSQILALPHKIEGVRSDSREDLLIKAAVNLAVVALSHRIAMQKFLVERPPVAAEPELTPKQKLIDARHQSDQP